LLKVFLAFCYFKKDYFQRILSPEGEKKVGYSYQNKNIEIIEKVHGTEEEENQAKKLH